METVHFGMPKKDEEAESKNNSFSHVFNVFTFSFLTFGDFSRVIFWPTLPFLKVY